MTDPPVHTLRASVTREGAWSIVVFDDVPGLVGQVETEGDVEETARALAAAWFEVLPSDVRVLLTRH